MCVLGGYERTVHGKGFVGVCVFVAWGAWFALCGVVLGAMRVCG